MQKYRVLSLFSGAGIAEFGFEKLNIDIKLANELLPVRAKVHQFWHPHSKMICGDITDNKIKSEIITEAKKEKIDFIFSTPPCQGVSLIGKNKTNDQMIKDSRNYLIFHTFDIIDSIKPKIVLIENVDRFFKVKLPYNNKLMTIEEIITLKYQKDYNLKFDIFDAADYGVPQHRKRAIIRLFKNGISWNNPMKMKTITVREAIGDLPSLESGEKSTIKNHYARNHTKEHVLWMKHTPTGHSAFENKKYFPKNSRTGERIKGYMASYKRIEWDKPAPTITMRNDCLSSQSNCHPGRKLKNGTYSDARVLTLREIYILSTINPDIDLPDCASESQIRYMIGEAVPPKLIESILKGIK